METMENIEKLIRERKSVRAFDGKGLKEQHREKLLAFMETIENPYKIPVKFKMLNAKESGLTCPVVVGANTYVGGKIQRTPYAEEAFGYAFEMLVLYAWSLGIGTVWVGGTMNRSAFEKAMELDSDEMMPCASPLGYPAKKKSLRERMMRKAIKADERMPFDKLFFDGTFDTPLTQEKAGVLAKPLEMVRWSPSAVNKQPWRVVVTENAVHFYLKRSKGFSHGSAGDMQKIDMGIALCHFALAAQENGLRLAFELNNPDLPSDPETEYIASYRITR